VGALLIFDITKLKTFDSLERWLQELEQFAEPGIVTMIVGNKSDLKKLREVTTEQALQFAE
jgi:GTPase SAR1 family protein